MGDKKEQEQSAQGTPNPWIYDVSKRYSDRQPGYGQPGGEMHEPALPEGFPLPPARQRRAAGLLWIVALVLLLAVAAVVVGVVLLLK